MISVIVPMYNSEDTIIKALDSIKEQSFFNYILEIIIINDGSTDNSMQILNQYINENIDMPIIIIDKSNGGVSTARNAGLKIARGKYIALLDSDDEWLPNKIETQIKILEENPQIDFLGAAIDDKPLYIFMKKIDGLYKATVKDICLKAFPQTSTAIFKRDIIDTIGLYNENQRYGEDINFYFRICNKFNFYYIPIKLVNFGGGKRPFGESGLSSNLQEMHYGSIYNIKELKEKKIISRFFYIFLIVLYYIKYIRRIIITKVNSIGKI